MITGYFALHPRTEREATGGAGPRASLLSLGQLFTNVPCDGAIPNGSGQFLPWSQGTLDQQRYTFHPHPFPICAQPEADKITLTECKDRISGVVNFVTGNLRPVKSDVDERLSAWYKENSRVYVAADHACWSSPDLSRMVYKRRFGTVVRSPSHGLNKMMQFHAEEAQEWILERTGSGDEGGDTTEEENDNTGTAS